MNNQLEDLNLSDKEMKAVKSINKLTMDKIFAFESKMEQSQLKEMYEAGEFKLVTNRVVLDKGIKANIPKSIRFDYIRIQEELHILEDEIIKMYERLLTKEQITEEMHEALLILLK